MADPVREQHQHGRHEQRDLKARADGDVERQIHLVLDRHEHRGRVLGGVADHRDHDHPHEHLGEAEAGRGFLHRAHQQFAHPGHEGGADEQRDDCAPGRGDGLRFGGRRGLLADVEMSVRAQTEDQAQDVHHQQHDRDLPRQAPLDRDLTRSRERGAMHGVLGHQVEHRRHQQADRREAEQRGAGRRCRPVEGLALAAQAAGQDGKTQHQQDVADDRTGEARLDDLEQAPPQRDHCEDELGGVAERGI